MSDETRPQRDWLGHALQFVGLLAVFGLPVAYWAINTNATMATMLLRIERQDRDIAEQRQAQTLVTNQIVEVGKGLARIETNLENIREPRKTRR